MNLERSLILIQPIAISNVDDVMRKIFYAGFHTIQRKYFVLTADEILQFRTLAGKFNNYQADSTELVVPNKENTYMAICVCKENAIDKLRQLFAENDAIHVSQSASDAHREIKFFFPNVWTKSLDHSGIDEILDHQICGKVFPILSKSLLEMVEKCSLRENDIDQLRTALILRNPMKPIIFEPEIKTK